MKSILSFLSAFLNNYKLLLIISLPAIALTAFGLHQLGVEGTFVWVAALLMRLVVEFAFLGLCLGVLNGLGIKNKWVLAILLYAYYWACTADLALLLYFKERFGAKYLETMEGGADYGFLKDWRLISYFTCFLLFCLFSVGKLFRTMSCKQSWQKVLVCGIVLSGLTLANPLALLPKPNDFLTTYFMSPSPVYTIRSMMAKPQQATVTHTLDDQTTAVAQKYHVFNAQNTGVGKDYKRVILIATESMSSKYLHRYNPLIPASASRSYDEIFQNNPSTTLHPVTLSTLYGLTVLFSSHPHAKLVYENQYPLSLVKELKKQGFGTAFLRGANEKYMDEHILFHQAGFEDVKGSNYFSSRKEYAPYISWWGLTDRKLFEYALEYLQENKDNKTFLTLLTVDTHVPLGRLDYLDHTYQETQAEFYDQPTLPRAFSRAGQDVEIFLKNLQEKGLFDDDTLIILTADHPNFSNTPTNKLFKNFQTVFDRVPFAVITKDQINRPLLQNDLTSQLDVAPTILDLLNLPQPKGFFGHSLFDISAKRSIFDIKEDYVKITTADGEKIIPLNSKKEADQAELSLIGTMWVD
ncbi:MAG: sulfatase-like hydrolase/transferase [Elusimicrobiaceae bacterium]|nr:sulfatase-like hydrolase/transferase [Elusimicrobiaceae bacterium]